MHKPFRPLFVYPGSIVWTNEIPDYTGTSVVRGVIVVPRLPLPAPSFHPVSSLSPAIRLSTDGPDASFAVGTDLSFVPLFLVSASSPLNYVGGGAFQYIQGAGDDEESWAHGLTPSLFWYPPHRPLPFILPRAAVPHQTRTSRG